MKEFDHLFELEKQLHSPEIRSSPEEISRLLSENFLEFGSSGKTWTREAVLKDLLSENETAKSESFNYKAILLAQDVVLITYVSTRVRLGQKLSSFLRSSIWRRNNGVWQMEFHQGTPMQD